MPTLVLTKSRQSKLIALKSRVKRLYHVARVLFRPAASRTAERYVVEIRDLEAFRASLGPEVLTGFIRCFVHADRLQSLTSFMFISRAYYGDDAVPFKRNLQTMIWFAVGTLRELAHAIRELRSAMHKRGILDKEAPAMQRLREVERKWDRVAFFRDKRDKAAFHVDAAVIDDGIQAIMRDLGPHVVLSEGTGRHMDARWLSLGELALVNGIVSDLPEFERFVSTVGTDYGIGETVMEAFLNALKAAGIPYGLAD
jgi:hypothetical protein